MLDLVFFNIVYFHLMWNMIQSLLIYRECWLHRKGFEETSQHMDGDCDTIGYDKLETWQTPFSRIK